MKKTLSIILLVSMLLASMVGIFSFSASAAEISSTWPVTDDATPDIYEVNNAAELRAFATKLSQGEKFTGKTIQLTTDIDLNPDFNGTAADVADATAWPSMSSAIFEGSIDGQGHTISGIYQVQQSHMYHMFGRTGTVDTTFKNFTIRRSYIYNQKWQSGALICHVGTGNLTFDSVHVDNDVTYVSDNDTTAFYVGYSGSSSGNIEIKNCIFRGAIQGKGSGKAAAVFAGYISSAITITNCAMYGTVKQTNGGTAAGIIAQQAAKTATISNVIVAGDVQTYVENGATKARYVLGTESTGAVVTATNIVIADDENATYSTGYATSSGSSTTIYAKVLLDAIKGTAAHDALNEAEITGFVASENAGELPVLTPENIIIVNAASHLKDFATKLSQGEKFTGKTITLTADIDLNPEWTKGTVYDSTTFDASTMWQWPSMTNGENSTTTTVFEGSIDGQGHTISGIYYTGGYRGNDRGMLATTGTADTVLQNFTIEKSYMTIQRWRQGALINHAGTGTLTIDKVNVADDVIFDQPTTNNWATGGNTAFYVGLTYSGAGLLTISNCVFSGTVSTYRESIGIAAFVGRADSNVVIENCAMYGTVASTGGSGAGFIYQQGTGTAEIKNVIVAGNVQTYVESGTTKAKYILGTKNSGTTVTVTNIIVTPDEGGVTYANAGAAPTHLVRKTRAELALGTGAQTVLEAAGFTSFVASSLPNGLPVPKGTVTNRVYDGITELAGYQTKPADTGTGVRLVGIADIDSTDFVNYEFVGFHVVAYASDASKYQTVNTFYHETKNLYTSIAAGDGTWSPAPTTDGNPPYIFVQEIKNIPAIGEVIFEVTSFCVKKDKTVVIGKTSTVTVDTGVKETQTPDGGTTEYAELPLLNGSSASYTEINDTAYLAYKTKLANAGAVEQQTIDLEGNLFSTYFHSGIQYNLSYYPSTDMLKVHRTNKAYMPSTSGTLANGEVWQLGLEMPTGSAPGMSYVAKVGENEFVVVDGGLNSENNIAALKAILGSDTPTVHWVFTHNHPDHVGLASAFIGKYADEINLATVAHSFTVKSSDAGIVALARDKGAKICVMHAGQEVYFGGCKVTVLSTHEELYTASISALKNQNAESTVFKMTFANGSMLVLGDATTMVANHLTQYFTSVTLGATVLQAAHHGTVASDDVDDGTGYAGALATLYTRVAPNTVAVPNQTNPGVLGASGYGSATVVVAGTSGSQKLIG